MQSPYPKFLTGRYCGVRGGLICSRFLLGDTWHRLRCAHDILNVSRPLSGPPLVPRYASRENTGLSQQDQMSTLEGIARKMNTSWTPQNPKCTLGDTLGDRSLTLPFFYLLILQHVATVFKTIARSPTRTGELLSPMRRTHL